MPSWRRETLSSPWIRIPHPWPRRGILSSSYIRSMHPMEERHAMWHSHHRLSDVQSGCTLLLIEKEHAPFIWKTDTLLDIAKDDASSRLMRETLSHLHREGVYLHAEKRDTPICIECVCFLYTERRHPLLNTEQEPHSSRKTRNNLLATEYASSIEKRHTLLY